MLPSIQQRTTCKAIRVSRSGHEHDLSLVLDCNDSLQCEVLTVKEDESMCDGLGGGLWDGTLLLSKLLEGWLRPRSAPATWQTPIESSTSGLAISIQDRSCEGDTEPPYIVELGAGTGILGLVCHTVNGDIDVRLTDRYTDLIAENVQTVVSTGSRRGKQIYASLQAAIEYQQRERAQSAGILSLAYPSEAKIYDSRDHMRGEDKCKPDVTDIHPKKKRSRGQRSPAPPLAEYGQYGDDGAKDSKDESRRGSEDDSMQLQGTSTDHQAHARTLIDGPATKIAHSDSHSDVSAGKYGVALSPSTRFDTKSSQNNVDNASGRAARRLQYSDLTWTYKLHSDYRGKEEASGASGVNFNPAPTTEEQVVLFSPREGRTYENKARYPDLLLGAEVAVLLRQQEALVSTIHRLAGPQSLILITADGKPSYPAKSKYEQELDAKFTSLGYKKAILAAGRVTWETLRVPTADRGRTAGTAAAIDSAGATGSLQGLQVEENKLELPPAVDAETEKSSGATLPCRRGHSVKVATLRTYDVRVTGRTEHGTGREGEGSPIVLVAHEAANKMEKDVEGLSGALTRSHLNDVPPPLPDEKHCSVQRSASSSYKKEELSEEDTQCASARKKSSAAGGKEEDSGNGGGGGDGEDEDEDEDDLSHHHINAYFKPSLLSTCARCHQPFFNNPRLFSNPARGLFNPQLALCRYHPQYYVCRFHPAEIGSSGDGLGYYGNGEDGYDASFWDCCNNSDRDAPGCMTGPHIVYH